MSHISFPSDFPLLVRDARGRYSPATIEQILAAARQVVDQQCSELKEFQARHSGESRTSVSEHSESRWPPAFAGATKFKVDQKMQRGANFGSLVDVKAYLRAKLGGLDHEVFAVLFLDNRHRLIEYVEMFRGTLDGASVHPREVVKEALRLSAATSCARCNGP